MPLYFGYGSNLDPVDWARFCSDRDADPAGLAPLERAWLPDHRLTFNHHSTRWNGGAANITPATDHIVPGYLFEVDEATLAVLDAKEGAPRVYRRVEVPVILEGGRICTAISYALNPERNVGDVEPTEAYLEAIRRGFKHHGMKAWHLGVDIPIVSSVFVYGTLRDGESRAHVLDGVRTLAHAQGKLLNIGAYPGLVAGEGEVVGEVIGVQSLAELDGIEGFHGWSASTNLYNRGLIEAVYEDGGTLGHELCWTYFWNGSLQIPRIESGDWCAR